MGIGFLSGGSFRWVGVYVRPCVRVLTLRVLTDEKEGSPPLVVSTLQCAVLMRCVLGGRKGTCATRAPVELMAQSRGGSEGCMALVAPLHLPHPIITVSVSSYYLPVVVPYSLQLLHPLTTDSHRTICTLPF